jgi:hypothetical protein
LELSSTADDITLRPGNVDTVTVSQALITSTADLLITRAAPRIHLEETGAAVNNTRWDILLDAEQLQFRVLSDDELTHTDWLTVDRTLNVIDTVAFIATTFDVTGNITVSGTVDGRDVLADGTAQDSHIADTDIHYSDAPNDANNYVRFQNTWVVAPTYAFGEYVSGWDASAGTFPAATNQGDWFNVTVAGTVSSEPFVIGDTLIALVDSPSTTIFAANWSKVPHIGIDDHTLRRRNNTFYRRINQHTVDSRR